MEGRWGTKGVLTGDVLVEGRPSSPHAKVDVLDRRRRWKLWEEENRAV